MIIFNVRVLWHILYSLMLYFVFFQESGSARFCAVENRTVWWCRTRGVTVQLDLLSSPSPATLNVNSGLHHQDFQLLSPDSDPVSNSWKHYCINWVAINRWIWFISWLRWHVARKSECTAQCGLGYRTLEIYCTKFNRPDGKIQKVDDRYCSGQRKPEDKESCHGDCNPGGWDYSPWSEVQL